MNEIVSNPKIMDGVPIFFGTRIAVSMIETMIRFGAEDKELLDAFPTLTQAMIDKARSNENFRKNTSQKPTG